MTPATVVPGVFGIDPGTTGGGGAVLCSGGGRPRARLAVWWTARGEKFTVRWVVAGPRIVLNQADVYGIAVLGTALGGLAQEAAPDLLIRAVVSEAPYIGVNPQSALSVARTGAALEATAAARLVSPHHVVRTRTVEPTSWRSILGISAPDREKAKENSLRYVPLLVDGLAALLDVLSHVDHVTDAAGVAAVGLRCAAWEGEVNDWRARVAGSTGKKKKPAAKRSPAKAGAIPKRPGGEGR